MSLITTRMEAVLDPQQQQETDQQFVFDKKLAKKLGDLMMSAKKIAVISHRGPDGDTTGSGLALRDVLQRQGKSVENVCVDPIPLSFRFLPDVSLFVSDFDPARFDLTIAVDAAARHQTGFHQLRPELFAGKFPLLNIDHHISNEMFGTDNLIDVQACSTTAVLWKLFDHLRWKVSPAAATCLLNGLLTDTGSLQHSNSTPESFRIAAKLLAAGADLQSIRKYVFRTTPVPTLKLWGRILERIEMNSQKIVSSTVSDKDFLVSGADPKDASGAIDFLNMVPDAKYAMLLTERGGRVKGSLRTQQEDVNVSDIAGKYGGGGHIKAAGFSVPGHLQVERRFKIIKESER